MSVALAAVAVGVFVSVRKSPTVPPLDNQAESKRLYEKSAAEGGNGSFQVMRIIDGDTIEVKGSDDIKFTIRFDGIDAPELAQPHGPESRQMLQELVGSHAVSVKEVARDKFGRYLAQVFCNGMWLNKEMLLRGGAWRYLAGSHFGEFTKAQDEAKAKPVGLWNTPSPVPPWEARKK